MIRFSNSLIGVLNVLTFLLSIPILVAGVWLSRQSSSHCDQFLAKPMIVAGVFLLVVSVAGIIGSCCRISSILWFYLLVMFLLILLLFCFTIFAFVVANKGPRTAVSDDRGYKEYLLGDYSNWLQKRVSRTKNWNRIKNCLEDTKICTNFIYEKNGTELKELYKMHLSAIESGCCKPPDVCNFTYEKVPANWTQTADSNLTDPDCTKWGNELTVRCYNCESCKAGMIDNIKTDWKKVAVVNTIFLVFLVSIYSIGCCAFRNNRQDNSGKHP